MKESEREIKRSWWQVHLLCMTLKHNVLWCMWEKNNKFYWHLGGRRLRHAKCYTAGIFFSFYRERIDNNSSGLCVLIDGSSQDSCKGVKCCCLAYSFKDRNDQLWMVDFSELKRKSGQLRREKQWWINQRSNWDTTFLLVDIYFVSFLYFFIFIALWQFSNEGIIQLLYTYRCICRWGFEEFLEACY